MTRKKMTNTEARTLLVKKIDTLKTQLLAKFDSGRRHHANEEIYQLDFDQEIQHEIFDLIIYTMLKSIVYDNSDVGRIHYKAQFGFTGDKRAPKKNPHPRQSKLC